MDNLEQEFIDLINKVKANLEARELAGEISYRDSVAQAAVCDQLLENNQYPIGWNTSNCAWDASSVC